MVDADEARDLSKKVYSKYVEGIYEYCVYGYGSFQTIILQIISNP